MTNEVISSETTVSLEMSLEKVFKSDMYTPYAISRDMNVYFTQNGISKEIRPQMMYSYDKNGLIVKGQKNRKKYTKKDVIQFVASYIRRNADKLGLTVK